MFNNDETQKLKPIENGDDLDGGVDSSDLVVVDGETAAGAEVATAKPAAPANKPWKDSSKKKPKKPKQKPIQKPKQAQKTAATAASTTTSPANSNSTTVKNGNKDDGTHSDDDEEKNSDSSSENEEDENNRSDGAVESLGAKSQEDRGDEYFEKFQQMQKKKEKLETKAKISHRVYCPFYPDVRVFPCCFSFAMHFTS